MSKKISAQPLNKKKAAQDLKSGLWRDWYFFDGEIDTYFLKRDIFLLIKSNERDGETFLSDKGNRLYLNEPIYPEYIRKEEAKKLSRYENHPVSIVQFSLDKIVEFITFDEEGNSILGNKRGNLSIALEDLKIELKKKKGLITKHGKIHLGFNLELQEKELEDKIILLGGIKKVIKESAYWSFLEQNHPNSISKNNLKGKKHVISSKSHGAKESKKGEAEKKTEIGFYL